MRKPSNLLSVALSFSLLIVGVTGAVQADVADTKSAAAQKNDINDAERSIEPNTDGSGSAVVLAPPTNDDINNPIRITNVPYSNTQDVSEATTAADDPWINYGDCQSFLGWGEFSVWYRYTPSQDGTLIVDTVGSDYQTVVAVWTGTRGNLDLRGCDANSLGPYASRVQVTVSAGVAYLIEVVDFADAYFGSSLTISVDFDPIILDVGPVVYDRHTIDDGAGDGILDCGETYVEFHVALLNQGADTATGVNAEVSTSDPYVTLPDNNLTCGDMPGGEAPFCDWFEVTAAANTPNGHIITFDLDITATNGGPWTDSFSVAVSCNPPPSNDDFDNAIEITDVPYSNTQDVQNATTAVDDPWIDQGDCQSFFGYGEFSVWYEYTPSQDGTLTVNTVGSGYQTVVAVWTGTRGNLTFQGCDANSLGPYASEVQISVSAGVTYYIEVVDFADAYAGSSLTISVDFFPETLDVGPLVYDGHTIDDSSGDGDGILECGEDYVYLDIDLLNQGTDKAAGVYATIDSSSPFITLPGRTSSRYPDIAGGGTETNSNAFVFGVAPNTPDGRVISFDLGITASNGGPWTDSFNVTVSCETQPSPNPPPNDDIDDAIEITNVPYSNTQDVSGATTAGDDPWIAQGDCQSFIGLGIHSVWYQYTPSQDGFLIVDTIGSDYQTVVAIWTGTRGNLTLEGCDANSIDGYASQIEMPVLSGVTYYIEVVDFGDAPSGSSLTISVDFSTSFACETPGKPVLVSPADNTTISFPRFAWNSVNDANEYQIQIDNDANFSSFEIDETTPMLSTIHMELVGDTYSWRVRGHNTSLGCDVYGPWSDVWTTTVSAFLSAQKLEVTQGIQDLNNSVRLVAGKRTYVRFNVKSVWRSHLTTAKLHVMKGNTERWLDPINGYKNTNGKLYVRPAPDRGMLTHSFIFELPDGFNEGNITLTGEVNPDHDPIELDYEDNASEPITVSFEDVPTVNLVIYKFAYQDSDGTNYVPTDGEVDMMISWLERAFPLSDLRVRIRNDDLGEGIPDCGDVLSWLEIRRNADTAANPRPVPEGTRYYGMVSDDGGHGGGLGYRPGFLGCGSNAYGERYDWTGAHELGHNYDRHHAEFCGAIAFNDTDDDKVRDPGEDYPDGYIPYPHAFGRISPALTGDTAIYGFDIAIEANVEIYGPTNNDLMTYCNNKWVSDFTYHGIMDYLQNNPVKISVHRRSIDQTDRLLVFGSIDPKTNQVSLQPMHIMFDVGDLEPRTPGDYAIVLRDSSNAELARYPFTPDLSQSDSTCNSDGPHPYSLGISELVPYVAGTIQVDIEGPSGVLKTVVAGAATPSVNLSEPNGGETLNDDPITVSWTANDPDGDPLAFDVQYSHNNGSTWVQVAQNVTSNSADIDAVNIVSGDQALFRVVASDGIHTAMDESDAPFTVPNRIPTAAILTPMDGKTVTVDQTLSLQASAYDIDTGTMDDSQLEWISSRDGSLGNGDQLTVVGLSEGTHTITLQADDGNGGTASDTVQVTVVSDISQLPPVPDLLAAGPSIISLAPAAGETTARVSVDNQNAGNAIRWEAVSSETWLSLSVTSGTTPFDDIILTVDDADLADGVHPATVTFTSQDVPGESATIQIEVHAGVGSQVFLPQIQR